MTKSTSQARINPEVLSTLGPNHTRKARPDLQVWRVIYGLAFLPNKNYSYAYVPRK